jgi:hypothetical protein
MDNAQLTTLDVFNGQNVLAFLVECSAAPWILFYFNQPVVKTPHSGTREGWKFNRVLLRALAAEGFSAHPQTSYKTMKLHMEQIWCDFDFWGSRRRLWSPMRPVLRIPV